MSTPGTGSEKILSFEALRTELERLRAEGRRVVVCHGVFDLVHPGHIRHLEEARNLGDVLVATVAPDLHMERGPGRPVFDERTRAEGVAALQAVDLVAVDRSRSPGERARALRPHVVLRSALLRQDVASESYHEEEDAALAELGCVVHLPDRQGVELPGSLAAVRYAMPRKTRVFLEKFERQYSM